MGSGEIEIGTAVDIPAELAGEAAQLADSLGSKITFSKRGMLAGPNDLFDIFTDPIVLGTLAYWANKFLDGAASKLGGAAVEKLMVRFSGKHDDPALIGAGHGEKLDKLIDAIERSNEARGNPWELRLGIKEGGKEESRAAILFESSFSSCTDYRDFFAQYILSITSIGHYIEAVINDLNEGQVVQLTFTGTISLKDDGSIVAQINSSEIQDALGIQKRNITITLDGDESVVIRIVRVNA